MGTNMKALIKIGGVFLIVIGILFLMFLRALNDPEVEGESGRISLGTYCLSLIPITLGVVILFLQQKEKSN